MLDTGRKKFTIPHQIDNNFYIWRFVAFMDLIILAPTAGLGYLIYKYLIPPWMGLQFQVFFSCLPFILVAAMIFVRPIPQRKNINLYQQLKWRIQYNQRQKKFYYKRKIFKYLGD